MISDTAKCDVQRCRQPRWLLVSAVCGLLLAHAVIAAWSVRGKSATFDEVSHLVAGYSYWATNDYRLLPSHIAGRWAAIPLLFGDDVPPRFDGQPWWHSNHWTVGFDWLYESGNDADWILLRARLMIVLLSLATGAVVFFWSRRLFGTAGGLLSLTLYAFSPTMLAHSRLVTADMATAFGFLVSVGGVWRLLYRVSWGNMLATALACGWLVLAKPSGLAVIPMALALLAVRVIDGKPLELRLLRPTFVIGRSRQCAILSLAAIIVAGAVIGLVWLCHGFRYEAMRDAIPGRDQFFYAQPTSQAESGLVHRGVRIARDYRLLPEAYLVMLEATSETIAVRTSFLNGKYSHEGWRTFFPYVFLIKTPLVFLATLALAGWAGVRMWRHDRSAFARAVHAIAPLVVLLAVYWLLAVGSRINIGHRHILATYPPLFVLAGAAAHPVLVGRHQRLRPWLLAAITLPTVVEAVLVHPHYLAYFNQIVGGPSRAYRHVVDSSLDWGQDLPGLARWLEGRGLQDPVKTSVYLSYFGTASPQYYGIRAFPLPGFGASKRVFHAAPLGAGVYCISATMLQGVYSSPNVWSDAWEPEYQAHVRLFARYREFLRDPTRLRQPGLGLTERDLQRSLRRFDDLRFARLCAFLRQREPDAHVGYSILIYKLSEDDVRRVP